MPLYEYTCDTCGKIHEDIRPIARRKDPLICECLGIAHHIVSPTPFYLDGTDPGFPGAYDRWAKDHEKRAKVGYNKVASHGSE